MKYIDSRKNHPCQPGHDSQKGNYVFLRIDADNFPDPNRENHVRNFFSKAQIINIHNYVNNVKNE